MKLIPLTQGKFAIIDDEDFEKVSSVKWFARKDKQGNFYAQGIYQSKVAWVHRFILNAPEGVEVDHKDGNGLNNTRENLRFATRQQNNCNKSKQKNNTTGFKGVSRVKYPKDRPYRAKIKLNKIDINVGHFKTPEEAARAYDEKARELHGEFAGLNFPEENGRRDATLPQTPVRI